MGEDDNASFIAHVFETTTKTKYIMTSLLKYQVPMII